MKWTPKQGPMFRASRKACALRVELPQGPEGRKLGERSLALKLQVSGHLESLQTPWPI